MISQGRPMLHSDRSLHAKSPSFRRFTNHSVCIRHLATIACVIAALTRPASADEWSELPQRKPEFGQKMNVTVEILANEIDPALGTKPFEFDLAYWRGGELETQYKFATTRAIGGKPAPGDREFSLTKEYDPLGGRVSIGASPDAELLARVIDTSDLALTPLRCLVRHRMPSSSGGPAEKEMSGSGFHARWSERFAGVKQISITPLQITRGRTVRTIAPSGYRLIDHFLTYEDARDDSIMAAFCVRVLWRPIPNAEAGAAPPSGVYFAAILRMTQIDWLKEGEVIPADAWENEEDVWREMLAEDLFDSIGAESIGSSFDSPSAFVLRAMNLLTPPILHRVASRTDPKLLAAIAPIVVDQSVSFDPSRFDKAYEKAVDPVQRLLLGAAAAAGGSRSIAAYRADAAIALHSARPDTLRAAFTLARALGDAELATAVGAAIDRAPASVGALGLLALGAIDAPVARERLLQSIADTDPLRRAAALRGLADFGDATDASTLVAATELGAIDYASGEFRILLTGSKAGGALAEIHELAVAARAGDLAKATTRLQGLSNGLFATDVGARAAALAAVDWFCRLPNFVARLDAAKLDGSDGSTLRRIAMGSGRRVIPQLLSALAKAEGAEKKSLARIVGATKDPRVKEPLQALSDADSEADSEAGSAGLIEFQKD